MDKRAKLKLIKGGLQAEIHYKSVRIVAAPESAPPFEVDTIAFEEDTYLIMSTDAKIYEPNDHIIKSKRLKKQHSGI